MNDEVQGLYDEAKKAKEIIFKVNTVFPFSLFPDTITIDREKVTIANRFFFKVATVNSTPISDIKSIESNVGPFFGSLKITSEAFTNNERIITFLRKGAVIDIQRIIQGFMLAKRKAIDCDPIPKDQLIRMLKDLGSGLIG